ncbi:unnamed protein product [Rodentolepis nana]|uniref:Uncharacterized protein n=1 Tax=Rodentolepis nana TaxID=102285 RepID=A0A0R3TW37_RODNA|nr:unnamed protein product [Rodentolepis nana]
MGSISAHWLNILCTVPKSASAFRVFINCPALQSPCYENCLPTQACNGNSSVNEQCLPDRTAVNCTESTNEDGSKITSLWIDKRSTRLHGSWICTSQGIKSIVVNVASRISARNKPCIFEALLEKKYGPSVADFAFHNSAFETKQTVLFDTILSQTMPSTINNFHTGGLDGECILINTDSSFSIITFVLFLEKVLSFRFPGVSQSPIIDTDSKQSSIPFYYHPNLRILFHSKDIQNRTIVADINDGARPIFPSYFKRISRPK